MKTTTIAAVILAIGLIGGAALLSNKGSSNSGGNEPQKNNVTIEAGTQIVEIRAKGGFTPRKSVAQTGTPTTLRLNTEGTFDCSSSIRIPSLNISQNLPQSGVTDIALGPQVKGVLHGTCGMGMYPFEIDFQ